MKIVLIGNYKPDKQESMKRFADMLDREFQRFSIETELWTPTVLFGVSAKSTYGGLGKWLAYLDKWVLFPLILRWRLMTRGLNSPNIRFHICDHSNSPYLAHLPKDKTAITCHDVIAIRAGLGYTDSNQQASRFGVLLQKWILGNLKQAKKLACVSQFTLNQLIELVPEAHTPDKDWRVILNPFNAEFGPLPEQEKNSLLRKAGIKPGTKFILHVGSDLPRKNRGLLPKMVKALGDSWNGYICFAGQKIDPVLEEAIIDLGLKDRVISVTEPPHEVLRALYNACEAFVFPSFNEGFGWPVIEAQACGGPVIASTCEPMPEVSGGAAIHVDPYNAEGFARALLSLQNPQAKEQLIKAGFENCKRFEIDHIIRQYLSLHDVQ